MTRPGFALVCFIFARRTVLKSSFRPSTYRIAACYFVSIHRSCVEVTVDGRLAGCRGAGTKLPPQRVKSAFSKWYSVPPSESRDRCYLIMEHDRAEYMGTLLV